MNLFKDSHDYYIQVGAGSLCTVAPMTSADLLNLYKSGYSIDDWTAQCRTEKLNASKEVGSVGALTLEFVSKDDGNTIYLTIRAKGSFEKDRLLKEQTVAVNMLNWYCLRYRAHNAEDLYIESQRRKLNAESLR